MNLDFGKKYFDGYCQGKGCLSQKNTPKYQKRLREIKVLRKANGKLLDIGCGFGFFLDKAKKKGFETYGLDISQYAISKVNKNHHVVVLDVSQKKFPFKNNFFDAITLDHVLEHVPNPVFVLKEIRRILKPKGLLFIEVPIRSRWPTHKTHVSYFNKISLSFILENLNFKIVKIGKQGGKFRNILGLIRYLIKGNTLFNFVPSGTGSFLICYATKKQEIKK